MKLAIDLESSDEEVFTQHLLSISTKNAKKQNINTCFGSIQFEVRHTAMTSKSQNHNPSGSEPHCRKRQHGPWQARGITRPNSNLQRGFYVLILRDFYVLFFFFFCVNVVSHRVYWDSKNILLTSTNIASPVMSWDSDGEQCSLPK